MCLMQEWTGLTKKTYGMPTEDPKDTWKLLAPFKTGWGWLNPCLWTGKSPGWEIILQLNSRLLPDDLGGPGATNA